MVNILWKYLIDLVKINNDKGRERINNIQCLLYLVRIHMDAFGCIGKDAENTDCGSVVP